MTNLKIKLFSRRISIRAAFFQHYDSMWAFYCDFQSNAGTCYYWFTINCIYVIDNLIYSIHFCQMPNCHLN